MRAPAEQLAVRSHDSCLTLQTWLKSHQELQHMDEPMVTSVAALHPQTAKTGVLANRRGLEATAHSFLLDPDHTHNPNH